MTWTCHGWACTCDQCGNPVTDKRIVTPPSVLIGPGVYVQAASYGSQNLPCQHYAGVTCLPTAE